MKVVVINKFGNWSFYVVDLQRTATKCIKVYDTRADPLFSSSSLLFGDVVELVTVSVVCCVHFVSD